MSTKGEVMSSQESQKTRTICFCKYHPDPEQALSAMPKIKEMDGVAVVEQFAERGLRVSYDLRKVTLEQIESSLKAAGFHLDVSLTANLRRSLFYYTEENERQNEGYIHNRDTDIRQVFVNRYGHVDHGCRDKRPKHLRRYL